MIKSHTFRRGKYMIHFTGRIDGVCDIPGNPDVLDMIILEGKDKRALNSHLHEALHAEGYPDKLMHDEDGDSNTERIANFLWRCGWRRVEKSK